LGVVPDEVGAAPLVTETQLTSKSGMPAGEQAGYGLREQTLSSRGDPRLRSWSPGAQRVRLIGPDRGGVPVGEHRQGPAGAS